MLKSNNLSQKIANQTCQIFDNIYEKKFKISYSLSKKYTVICSIGFINKKTEQFKIISISNGTKSLPYEMYKQNKGYLLKDTHAEILAIKAFRKWIIDQITKNNKQFFIFDQKKKKYQIKTKLYQIFLYSSQKFCGDCSISDSLQQQIFSGAKPLKYFNLLSIPLQENNNRKYQKYILRTKPGRNDLPLSKKSLSLSCSDKLALYNVLGIQGKQLFNLIKPVYIDKIIVDRCNKSNQNLNKDIKNGLDFVWRLEKLTKLKQDLIFRKIFNISINNQQRSISKQFKLNYPQIECINKLGLINPQQKQGIQVSYISNFSTNQWISGRTGLPEGVSLKNYLLKRKFSQFSKININQKIKQSTNKQENQNKQIFKYNAIKDRLKKLFKIWTDDFKT